MLQDAPSRPIWSLRDTLASLSYGPLSGDVDLARPSRGLLARNFPKARRPTVLLGIHRSAESRSADKSGQSGDVSWWPLSVSDAYVRGDDLVATYQPATDWPFAPQVYWRADSLGSIDGLLGSVSVWVSVQTALLDTHPQISVLSQFYSNELLLLSTRGGAADVRSIGGDDRKIGPGSGACCVVSRIKESTLSYIEIVSSEDFKDLLPRHDGDGFSLTVWRLFSEFLEKGVIRRARVHAALVPRKNDLELAAACCEAVERLALPLTA